MASNCCGRMGKGRMVVVRGVVGRELPITLHLELVNSGNGNHVALLGKQIKAPLAARSKVLIETRRIRVQTREDEALVGVDMWSLD